MPITNLAGKKFFKLAVVKDSGNRANNGKVIWECICDCGAKCLVVGANLVSGNSSSCGWCERNNWSGVRVSEYVSGSDNKKYHREVKLLKKYGVTLEWYEKTLKEQDYKCFICRKPEEKTRNGVLCVDHCHGTGKVRGLLCVGCNLGLRLIDTHRSRVMEYLDR